MEWTFAGKALFVTEVPKTWRSAVRCLKAWRTKDLSDPVYVFDFDKTLVSLPVDIEYVRKRVQLLMKEHDIEGEPRPLLGVLEKMKERGGQRLKDECETIIKEGEMAAVGSSTPMPGLEELDAALKGERWAVVTNNNSDPVKLSIGKWMRQMPSLVVGRNDVQLAKPSPEGLIKAANALGTSNLVYIGDSTSDHQAAENAISLNVIFWGVGEGHKLETLHDVVKKMLS